MTEKNNKTKVVAATIVDTSGKILLLQRSETRTEYPSKWAFVSGFIEDGETPEQCVYREIKEELGNKIKFGMLRIGESFELEEAGTTRIIYPYLFELSSGDIILDKEHSKYLWIDIADLYSYDVIPTLNENILHLHLDRMTFSKQEQEEKRKEHKQKQE